MTVRSVGSLPRSVQAEAPELSVVLCTYNRGDLLGQAVRSVLAHRADMAPTLEIIVVDNNSSDRTREIVADIARTDPRVRYTFEPEQGLSAARNAGIRIARAPFVAFIDDDVRVERDWARAIVRTFAECPDVDAVGGRVLPMWPAPPPPWLTGEHWAPLALADHGDSAIPISRAAPICLVGANLACRREVFETVGGFATELQRVKDGIGSLEDHEFLLRLLERGRKAQYDPRIVVHAHIQPERLQQAYHRRWHAGHGRFHARLRSEHVERSNLGTLLGVPAHLYAQAFANACGWFRCLLRGDRGGAFQRELRLRFFAGFFGARRAESRTASLAARGAELRRFVRAIFSSRPDGTVAVGIGSDRR